MLSIHKLDHSRWLCRYPIKKATIVVVPLALLLSACGQPDISGASATQSTTISAEAQQVPAQAPSATAVAPLVYSPQEQAIIDSAKKDLEQPNLDPATRKSLEDKIAAVNRWAQVTASYANLPTAVVPANPEYQPISSPEPTASEPTLEGSTEIVDTNSGPVPAAEAAFTSAVRVKLDGTWWIVYAGRYGLEYGPDQGILLIWPERLQGKAHYYETPEKVGPIRLVESDGQQLTVQAENGQTFVFDLQQRAFLAN